MRPIVRAAKYTTPVLQPRSSWVWVCNQNRLVNSRFYASAADLRFGQPVHETHPHLLKPGELTPGITALEYALRREKLVKALPPNSVAILDAADTKYRAGSVFYKFHQDSNFFYLTGFNEPDAFAIIVKLASGTDHIFHLLVRPKDPQREKWEGSRSGLLAARDVFNADEVGDVENATSIFPNILGQASSIFTDIPIRTKQRSNFTKIIFGSSASKFERMSEILQTKTIKPLRPLMNDLRAVKSEAEIKNLRIAGRASGRAFTQAMSHRYDYEKDLETFIEYEFKKNGCDDSAYVPVVGGGLNANQIHYVRNDSKLELDNLVTVDAGGEYGGYITDITRTWPVNGKFAKPQKDLYEVILKVQRQCISLCRENASMSLDKLHSVAESGLREGLENLGFDLSNNAMETLFPHHVGHYIGLDVHDAPGYSRTIHLRNNHCITIEPGIYVDDDKRWPKHFRGMGIRIEDSICIQEEHPLVLTTEAVKEVVDIEALRSN